MQEERLGGLEPRLRRRPLGRVGPLLDRQLDGVITAQTALWILRGVEAAQRVRSGLALALGSGDGQHEGMGVVVGVDEGPAGRVGQQALEARRQAARVGRGHAKAGGLVRVGHQTGELPRLHCVQAHFVLMVTSRHPHTTSGVLPHPLPGIQATRAHAGRKGKGARVLRRVRMRVRSFGADFK